MCFRMVGIHSGRMNMRFNLGKMKQMCDVTDGNDLMGVIFARRVLFRRMNERTSYNLNTLQLLLNTSAGL